MKMIYFFLLFLSIDWLNCFQKPIDPIIVYHLDDGKKVRVFSFALSTFHNSPLMARLKGSDTFSKIEEQWLNKLIEESSLEGRIKDSKNGTSFI